MENPLPSEIARLVFGYLKEESCDEAARIFLETSSHMQECRAAVARGKNFSTKFAQMNLIEILEKYCTASNIIYEKLSQCPDFCSDKKTTDLVEQLRYLLEGSRSQRFVVNINVPSQSNNQATGDSPIISGNFRKRKHSNTERDRSKRVKIVSQEKQAEQAPTQYCENIDATPLESLPGHTAGKNVKIALNNSTPYKNNSESNKSAEMQILENNIQNISNIENTDGENNKDVKHKEDSETKKCTMGTSTEELLTFATTEVQTMPFDINEPQLLNASDTEHLNLSLFTKELLGRPDVQETIAENINKAIHSDTTNKQEAGHSEAGGGEANIALKSEFDNVVKSSVAATEQDPKFAEFLSSVFELNFPTSASIQANEPTEETDTSPDEDYCANQKLQSPEKNQNSNSQDGQQKENTNSATDTLEDQNAAAVLSIMNIKNNMNNYNVENDTNANYDNPVEIQNETKVDEVVENNDQVKIDTIVCTSESKKVTKIIKSDAAKPVKKPRKQKSFPKDNMDNIIPEINVPTVPALVVCTREEMTAITYSTSTTFSKYPPIAPKTEKPAIYLKTVSLPSVSMVHQKPETVSHVSRPVRNVVNLTSTLSKKKRKEKRNKLKMLRSEGKRNKIKLGDKQASSAESKSVESKVESTGNDEKNKVVEKTKSPSIESDKRITLYGNENSTGTMLDIANMSLINLDDSFSFSNYLKLNTAQSESHAKVEKNESIAEPTEKEIAENSEKQKDGSINSKSDIIHKRTPKSLLKSRANNLRLSLSTPRRRNSHVRVLDFNTPHKISNSGIKVSGSQSVRSRSRAALFKSPPFTNQNAVQSPKSRKSVKILKPVSSPTLSPLPTVSNLWNTWGTVVGTASPFKSNATSAEASVTEKTKHVQKKQAWDANLRDSTEDNMLLNRFQNKVPSIKTNRNNEDKETIDKKDEEKPTDENIVDLTKSSDETKPSDVVKSSVVIKPGLNGSKEEISNPKPVKKYAQLKTITTTVTKVITTSTDVSPILGTKVVPILKISPEETTGHVNLPSLDLETPRKLNDTRDIPPTPKLLTPGNNFGNSTISSFMKICDDSTKIHNFIATPDFPPTPCINITPPHPADKTLDDDDVNKNCGANYYEPSKSIIGSERSNRSDSEKVIETNIGAAEIIQFEVIKENLSKEAAEKELKISTASKDMSNSSNLESTCNDTTGLTDTLCKSRLSYDNNSSGSDSDSSGSDSSSSSGSSSSSSSSSITSKSTSPKSAKKERKTPNKFSKESTINKPQSPIVKEISQHISNDCYSNDKDKNVQNTQKIENEISPTKVFPVLTKTIEEEEEETIKETPAKEDSAGVEATISETPSSSKIGVETVTNLTTKFSTFKDTDKTKSNKMNDVDEQNVNKTENNKLKIISVTNVPPDIAENLKHYLPRSQLPEKLQRTKEKLKEATKTIKKPPGRGKSNLIYKCCSQMKTGRSRNRKMASCSQKLKTGHKKEKEHDLPKVDSRIGFVKPYCFKDNLQIQRKEVEVLTKKMEVVEELKEENTSKVTKPCKKVIVEEELKCSNEKNVEMKRKSNENNTSQSTEVKEVNVETKENMPKLEDLKTMQKLKVDLVKRDLFSRNNKFEKITTSNVPNFTVRSTSRRNLDAKKILPPITENGRDEIKSSTTMRKNMEEYPRASSSAQDFQFPRVFESLNLIPTNKFEAYEKYHNLGFSTNASNSDYIAMEYDEKTAAPMKKRRRKFNSEDFSVRLTDEDGKDYVFEPTEYIELFELPIKEDKRRKSKLAPKPKTKELSICIAKTIASSPVTSLAQKECINELLLTEETKKKELELNSNVKEKQRKRKGLKNDNEIKMSTMVDTVHLEQPIINRLLDKLHGPTS